MSIHITTPTELQNINSDLAADYVLDNDLDMTGVTWTPIAYNDSFIGTFDGQGHTIRNLTVDDTGAVFGYASLFGYTFGATIHDVNLENITLIGDNSYEAGVLIGYSQDTAVSNVAVTGFTISGLVSTGVAGLIGFIQGGSVDACSCVGSINTPSTSFVGGLIGGGDDSDKATITNCYSDVSITIQNTSNPISTIAGFIGYGGLVSIEKCFSLGQIDIDISGIDVGQIGGFIGRHGIQTSEIKNCYSHSKVNCTGTPTTGVGIGGFCGQLVTQGGTTSLLIQNCYSSGEVIGGASVGGFIGEIEFGGGGEDFQIINCYSVGIVTGVNQSTEGQSRGIGGFIGAILSNSAEVSFENCAWWVGSSDKAVGYYDFTEDIVATLLENSWGTDEGDKTNFYSKDHAVYAQGA